MIKVDEHINELVSIHNTAIWIAVIKHVGQIMFDHIHNCTYSYGYIYTLVYYTLVCTMGVDLFIMIYHTINTGSVFLWLGTICVPSHIINWINADYWCHTVSYRKNWGKKYTNMYDWVMEIDRTLRHFYAYTYTYTNTVKCRYNADLYNTTFHTALRWLMHNINHCQITNYTP